jgi:MoaA/NifB/PqqE/SkfB family radical SAM enzyme
MARNSITEAMHFLHSYFSADPSYLIFFVTAVCNARCKHCFYWEEIASANAKKELKLDEIEKMAKSMNLIYLSIGGGEPFLRKDLPQIVEKFYIHSGILYCNIVTNGFYTDFILKGVEYIREHCPRLKLKIQISFDDFQEEHDAYRKVPGIFQKACDTLKALSEIRAKDPLFNLDLATCMTASNKERVTDLFDYMRKEADFDYYQFLYPRGNAEHAEEKDVTADEWMKALEHVHDRDIRKNHNPVLSAINKIAKDGIYRFLKNDEHPWDCLAGRKFVSITERGILQPCEVLGQMQPDYDSNLGTLADFDFDVRKAMATEKAKKVADYIIESKCRCSFECASNCNVVFAKKEAARVIGAMITGG